MNVILPFNTLVDLTIYKTDANVCRSTKMVNFKVSGEPYFEFM